MKRAPIPLMPGDARSDSFRKWVIVAAHQILDGIPEDNIALHSFFTTQDKKPNCGTIACGAGWLSYHPTFKALGVRQYVDSQGFPAGLPNGFSSFEKVFVQPGFNIRWHPVEIFAARNRGKWDEYLLKCDPWNETTDRDLLLLRLKYAYDNHCGKPS